VNAAVDFALEEAGGFENAEMLGDGREGEGEWFGKLRDSGFAQGQASENSAAGGIGKGGESGVERGRGIVNHMVYCCRDGFACQGKFSRTRREGSFRGDAFSQRQGSWRKLRPSTICRKERQYAAAAG
jgi:hypothetical protein